MHSKLLRGAPDARCPTRVELHLNVWQQIQEQPDAPRRPCAREHWQGCSLTSSARKASDEQRRTVKDGRVVHKPELQSDVDPS